MFVNGFDKKMRTQKSGAPRQNGIAPVLKNNFIIPVWLNLSGTFCIQDLI